MKKILSVCLLTVSGIYCYSFLFLKSSKRDCTSPTSIVLTDSAFSVTIVCAQTGGAWAPSSPGAAVSYLGLIAGTIFGIDSISGFHDVHVSFDSLYQVGVLEGIGDRMGANVPIGVNFEYSGATENTVYMAGIEKHTCTGNPCGCCQFVQVNHQIVGCFCPANTHPCSRDQPCNHTVTADNR